eukprot:1947652-Amphidinium_carterae.1
MAQTHVETFDKYLQPSHEVQHVPETKDPDGSTQLGSEAAAETAAAVKAGHSMASLQQGDTIATRPEYLEAHEHHMQTPEVGPDFALMVDASQSMLDMQSLKKTPKRKWVVPFSPDG